MLKSADVIAAILIGKFDNISTRINATDITLFIFFISLLLSVGLQTITNLDYDIGNQADDLTQQGGKQNTDKHDEDHADQGTENGKHILTQRVVVSNLCTEEQQNTNPNEGKAAEQAKKAQEQRAKAKAEKKASKNKD